MFIKLALFARYLLCKELYLCIPFYTIMIAFWVRYTTLFILLLSLCSWGEKAHRKINSSCVNFFPGELHSLKVWAPILGAHGSDADFRKTGEPTEYVKHFIDMDNYPDFSSKHKIEDNFEKACAAYGKSKVYQEGTLPWATDSTYKELVKNFKTGNWGKAVLTAADLGHYVGDGFMPLHITANYNGQQSAQTGIHRRYEETMIDQYVDGIQFRKSKSRKILNVHACIFNYIYANYSNVATLLQADKQVFETAGNSYNQLYYEMLWKKTDSLTCSLLEDASKTLASLIYTAWIEAGKPTIPEQLGTNF